MNIPTNPMQDALIYVQQSRNVMINRTIGLSYTFRAMGPSHQRRFTAVLINSLTGERFPSVLYNENDTLFPFEDEEGVIWYPRLMEAKRSAAAYMLDCLDFRYKVHLMPPCATERGRAVRRCVTPPSSFPDFGVNQGMNDDPTLTNLNEQIGANGEVLYEDDHPLIAQHNWGEFEATLQENIRPRDDLYLTYQSSHPFASQQSSLLVPSIIGSTSTLKNVLMSGNLLSTHQADFDRARVIFVNDFQQLISFCHIMKNCSWVAIDAEIAGGNTVCLISVAFTDPQAGIMTTIVVDCITLHSKIPLLLGPLLADTNTLKIIHSCGSMDASSLYYSFGITI